MTRKKQDYKKESMSPELRKELNDRKKRQSRFKQWMSNVFSGKPQPETVKIDPQIKKRITYKQTMMEQVVMQMEGGELPDKINLGFNFFHPEEEKTTLDIIQEKEQSMKDKIAQWYRKNKF